MDNVPPFDPTKLEYQASSSIVTDTINSSSQTPVSDPPFKFEPGNTTDFLTSGVSHIQKYNEINYNIELYLDNSGIFTNTGTNNRYPLNPAAILNLSIFDTATNWVTEGSITIMYLPEDADPKQVSNTGQSKKTEIGAKENADALKSYQFRADGFDLLRLSLVPETHNKQTTPNPGAIQINPTDPHWFLSYLFSIYDVEDVTSNIPGTAGNMSSYMRAVKLYFRDVRHQVLKTTNLEYSTGLSPNAVADTSLANGYNGPGTAGRVLFTGDAVKEIFNKAFDVDNTLKLNGKILAQYGEGKDWDKGASKLFYTSPAFCNAEEDIQYVFSHHVGSTTITNGVNDLCLLHTNRALKPNQLEPICITPLSEFFNKAGKSADEPGDLQLEHFFVTSNTNHTDSPSNSVSSFKHRAPFGKNDNATKDVKTAKHSQILSYSFVDMSAEMNSSAFRTTPVYSVDIGKRKFQTEFKNNDVVSAREIVAKSYIDKLYKEGSDSQKLFLTTLHDTKKTSNIFPTFSLNGDNKAVRQKNGILDLIYTGLFQNACVCFKVYGLTLRQSGAFIGIDKVEGAADNDFNDKLYGQWFVIRVEHVFEAGLYMNVIYAVKLHRFKAQQTAFGGVL